MNHTFCIYDEEEPTCGIYRKPSVQCWTETPPLGGLLVERDTRKCAEVATLSSILETFPMHYVSSSLQTDRSGGSDCSLAGLHDVQ